MASIRVRARKDGATYAAVLYTFDGKQTSSSFNDHAEALKFQDVCNRLGAHMHGLGRQVMTATPATAPSAALPRRFTRNDRRIYGGGACGDSFSTSMLSSALVTSLMVAGGVARRVGPGRPGGELVASADPVHRTFGAKPNGALQAWHGLWTVPADWGRSWRGCRAHTE